MFEKKYKADNERIEPTRESLLSLSYKMKREQAKKKDKKKAVRWIRSAAADFDMFREAQFGIANVFTPSHADECFLKTVYHD